MKNLNEDNIIYRIKFRGELFDLAVPIKLDEEGRKYIHEEDQPAALMYVIKQLCDYINQKEAEETFHEIEAQSISTKYINREELLKDHSQWISIPAYDDDYHEGDYVSVSAIENFPSANVRDVIKGHWKNTVEEPGETDGMWYCSACGKHLRYVTDEGCGLPNWCPECGAMMRDAENY